MRIRQRILTEPAASPNPGEKTPRRVSIYLTASFAFCVVVLLMTIAHHIIRSNDLRQIAAGIQVGEDVLEVDARLGGSQHGYEYGWPKFVTML